MSIPVDTLREACVQMADWLEGHAFRMTLDPDADPETAKVTAAAWVQGYRRAIFELRSMAEPAVVAPDDISELEGL